MNESRTWLLGLDLGSSAVKAVLLTPDGDLVGRGVSPSGSNPLAAAHALRTSLTEQNTVQAVRVVATGYGRNLANDVNRAVTEITCHAKGIRHTHPDVSSILDIGGQDAKAIRLDADGGVDDFVMNDRCAAGTGSFLELMARRFSVTIGDLSAFCGDDPGLDGGMESEISSTCAVFAESEVVGMMARGSTPVEVLRAVHRSVARRVCLMLRRIKAAPPLYFSGGVAQNETLRLAVEREIGFPVKIADHPQFMGALGAALM